MPPKKSTAQHSTAIGLVIFGDVLGQGHMFIWKFMFSYVLGCFVGSSTQNHAESSQIMFKNIF